MIGAGIFALTGQMAEMTGSLFSLAFLSAALIVSFSAYSYIKLSLTGFLGATALGILAFKGFTTITNSGAELKDPHLNLGRAIMSSIALCVVIYALVGFAVSSSLSAVFEPGSNQTRAKYVRISGRM